MKLLTFIFTVFTTTLGMADGIFKEQDFNKFLANPKCIYVTAPKPLADSSELLNSVQVHLAFARKSLNRDCDQLYTRKNPIEFIRFGESRTNLLFKYLPNFDHFKIYPSPHRAMTINERSDCGLTNKKAGLPLPKAGDYNRSSLGEDVYDTTISEGDKKHLGKLDLKGHKPGESKYITKPTAYIPYRSGDKWGLANSHGKVVIKPQFDVLFDAPVWFKFPDDYFLIMQDGMLGIVDTEKVILPPIFKDLRYEETPDLFWGINEDETRALYKLNRSKIIEANIDRVFTYNLAGMELYEVSKRASNNYSLFWFDEKTQTIKQWVAKDCYDLDFYILNSDKTIGVLKIRKSIKDAFRTFHLTFDEKSDRFIQKEFIDEKSEWTEEIAEDSGMWEEYSEEFQSNEVDLGEAKPRQEHIFKPQKPFKYRIDKGKLKLDVYTFSNSGRDSLLTKSKPVRIKFKKGQIELVDLNDNNWANYAIFQHKGLYGLVVNGEIQKARYKEKPKELWISKKLCFLQKETTGKIGVTHHNELIIPFKYDSLHFYNIFNNTITDTSHIQTWIDGKCGLISPTKELLPCKYSAIEQDGIWPPHYSLTANNKHGYYEEGTFIDAIYDYKVGGYRYFNNYLVYELRDTEGNFLGFGDPDGFYYFED